MNSWGGSSYTGMVIKVTKKSTVGTFENKTAIKPGDILVAVAHSGDWFFDWLILRTDENTNLVPIKVVGDYGQQGKKLGKITKPSLYSCLNELHNSNSYGQCYLAYTELED